LSIKFKFLPLSTIDYADLLSAVIFTYGCNFRCPFCHNPELVLKSNETFLSEKQVLSEIKQRQKLLEAVVVTGGEPLLHKDLFAFIKKLKSFGLKIKLDTNGSFPNRLNYLIQNKLIDYIAMDIKNSLEKYSITTGVNIPTNKIIKTIQIIEDSGLEYEFRTTVIPGFHTKADIANITQLFKKQSKYFIQNFVRSKHIDTSVLPNKGFSKAQLNDFINVAKQNVTNVKIQ